MDMGSSGATCSPGCMKGKCWTMLLGKLVLAYSLWVYGMDWSFHRVVPVLLVLCVVGKLMCKSMCK